MNSRLRYYPTRNIILWSENPFYFFGPAIFNSQTQWIVTHRDVHNIAWVLHNGDIVQLNNPGQWQIASDAMARLDGVVPYVLCLGNHDMGPGGSAQNRDSTLYNSYFPASRFSREPWYGAAMPGDGNDNYYCKFHADSMNFMVVSLEFGPTPAMLDWANDVVSSHPDHRVIVLTHCYLNHDNTLVGPTTQWNPHGYGVGSTGAQDGVQMWNNFVKLHQNIFMVSCGHILEDGAGRLSSVGVNGNVVHSLRANYQTPIQPNGGDGYLRLMRFSPAASAITVSTYSPWLNKYLTNDQQVFTLNYPMTAVAGSPAGPTLRLRTPPACTDEGDVIPVTLSLENLGVDPAAGFQAFLAFDIERLTFMGGTYTPAPFGMHLIGAIAADNGVIRLAGGTDVFAGQSPTVTGGLLATLQFQVLDAVNPLTITFMSHTPPSNVTDPAGQAISGLQMLSTTANAADLNLDGRVDGIDLGTLLAAWSIPPTAPGCAGAALCLADINCDGRVNGFDLGILLAQWSSPSDQ